MQSKVQKRVNICRIIGLVFCQLLQCLDFFDIYCLSQEVDSTPDSDSIPTVTYISCAMQFPDQVSNEQNAIDTSQGSGDHS